MSSSHSDRAVLHLVLRPPWAGDALRSALAYVAAGDTLVLTQEAVAAACAAIPLEADLAVALDAAGGHVMACDLDARGLRGHALRPGWAAIDDAQLVALATQCRSSMTWY